MKNPKHLSQKSTTSYWKRSKLQRSKFSQWRKKSRIRVKRHHTFKTASMIMSLDAMQQYLRRDCLEITGIPVLPVDKPKELVKELGSALGININKNDISTAHRLPDTKKVKDRIIVKFVRRDVREEVYKNRKRLVGKCTTCLPSVNEEIGLTAYRKCLFGKIHAFKRDKNYKFIWTANGRIHLRENEATTVFHFSTEEEFQDFLNPE